MPMPLMSYERFRWRACFAKRIRRLLRGCKATSAHDIVAPRRMCGALLSSGWLLLLAAFRFHDYFSASAEGRRRCVRLAAAAWSARQPTPAPPSPGQASRRIVGAAGFAGGRLFALRDGPIFAIF